MSEDTSEGHEDDLKGKAKKMAGEASEKASELAGEAKEAAGEFADDVKEATSDFANSAKEAASNAKEEWNKVATSTENKKMMAGLLAIFLGAFGIPKFILGYQKEGLILLVATLIGWVTSCLGVGFLILMATGIFGVIEGIIYLTKSDEEFYETYQTNKKPWL